jgi:hypothetical protein
VVHHKHVGEHAAHEAADVDAGAWDHGAEAKVPPDLAKQDPEIIEMRVHHAAE